MIPPPRGGLGFDIAPNSATYHRNFVLDYQELREFRRDRKIHVANARKGANCLASELTRN
jgi:hypothetical protein